MNSPSVLMLGTSQSHDWTEDRVLSGGLPVLFCLSGMVDIARQTVEFLYEENGGIPRDLYLPTIEDIKDEANKFTIDKVRKGFASPLSFLFETYPEMRSWVFPHMSLSRQLLVFLGWLSSLWVIWALLSSPSWGPWLPGGETGCLSGL